MSQSVDKLKELLFAPESEAIAALSKRIDAVFARAGTSDRFQASVVDVLDGALRDAEVARHDELAAAIAPLIVKTVKTEIHNSTDDLVEALYPAMGRMVKAYVASAIKDLTNDINRRLEANPMMLRLNALTSGRSAGELALADSQRLKVDDVFLIRRATGELVARWPNTGAASNLDHVLGGVLTAINEFTAEAFKAEGSALRQIDLGDARVYLRVSPVFLLAAKCSGTALVAAEQAFDEEFLLLIDQHRENLDAQVAKTGDASPAGPLLQDLSGRLETRLNEMQPGHGTLVRGVKPLTLLACLVGLPLAGWLAWSVYIDYRVGHVQSVARQIVETTSAMTGYPHDLAVSERGLRLTVSGLSPTEAVKAALMAQLRAALPRVEVRDQLSAVPTAGADVRPLLAELKQDQRSFAADLKAATDRQSLERAQRHLERTEAMLRGAALPQPYGVQVAKFAIEAKRLLGDFSNPATGRGDNDAMTALVDRARQFATDMTMAAHADRTLRDDASPPVVGLAAVVGAHEPLAEAAERVAVAAQRLIDLTTLRARFAVETAELRAQIAALPPPVAAEAPTPREDLERYVRAHAVFFADNGVFRDATAATTTLDELARLMARDGSLVRIIGFTDDAGTPAKNTAIAKVRAETVAAALIARGVASMRLVTLSRISAETNVSTVNGAGSANRRVEFEVGFIGEGAP